MKTINHTSAQVRAIMSTAPKIAVIAGPGSGKTATTVERIMRLIATGPVDPSRICAITFTNAAANELTERIEAAYALEIDQGEQEVGYLPDLGYCGTLHGLALRMLKQHGEAFGYGPRMSVIAPEAADQLLREKMQQLKVPEQFKEVVKLKQKGLPTGRHLTPAQLAVSMYFRELKENRIVDFDILLNEFAEWLAVDGQAVFASLFTHLFVDEVQDSAAIDWRIFHLMPTPNKFLVGDPDQSIYEFRGAAMHELLEFARDPSVDVIHLEDNFRSDINVCVAANRLIAKNAKRLVKVTKAVREKWGTVEKLPPAVNEGGEIAAVINSIKYVIEQGTKPDEIAVLCRTNDQVRAFVNTMGACSIPVARSEAPRLPMEISQLRALVSLLADPDNDALAYFYILSKYGRKGGRVLTGAGAAAEFRREAQAAGKSINQHSLKLPALANGLEGLAQILHREEFGLEAVHYVSGLQKTLPPRATLLDLAAALHFPPERTETHDGVHVLTYHGAKGREFDVVYLTGMEDETMMRKNDNPEEARRLVYVGLTRARHCAIITRSLSRITPWGETITCTECRFTKEMFA